MSNILILCVLCFLFAVIAFISYGKYIKYFNLCNTLTNRLDKREKYYADDTNTKEKTLNDYRKIVNFFLQLHSETPVALVDNDIKKSFEVKMSGSIIARCRLRSKGPNGTDKRVIKDGKLIYLYHKDVYVLVDDLKKLKNLSITQLSNKLETITNSLKQK
jgi:hypothetical protein